MKHGWSLGPVHWTDLNEKLQSARWKSVSFAAFASSAVPTRLGTYMIVAQPPLSGSELSQLRSPLYVGHSSNLRRRMRQHLGGSLNRELVAFNRLAFLFSPAPTIVAAKFRQQALITAFGPPLNRVAAIRLVPGTPIPAGHQRTITRSSE